MTHGLKSIAVAIGLGVATLMAGTALSVGTALADESPLGVVTYDMNPQRDVLQVGGREGQFRAIRFEVRQSDVEIINLQVIYGNGAPDSIDVKSVFKAGTSSRPLDLKGATRAIKQIIVTYRANGPAKIAFFGVGGGGGTGPGPGAGNWDRLGCKDVGFIVDHDTLKVGRKEGAYSAIRLTVRNAPIEMFNLRIVFGNGSAQDLPVHAVIPNGMQTRPIDLAGNARGIDHIDMLYRSIPTFKGTANVCVDGLQK